MKLSADFIARRSHNHRRDNPQISPITQIKVWVPTRGFSIRPRLAGFLAGIINCAKSIEFVSVFEIYVICTTKVLIVVFSRTFSCRHLGKLFHISMASC